MTERFEGYTARFAEPNEADEVYAFYDTPARTNAVYLRHKEIVQAQVEAGRFLTVRNANNNIVAASTVIPLADGNRIDCVSRGGRVIEEGCVAELSSVLKHGVLPNDKGLYPEGFFHPLLFGIPMVQAFIQAGKEVTGKPLSVDLLVTDIQTQKTNTISRIIGAESTRSPLKWELMEPADKLLEAFGTTTNDPNAQKAKQFFRAPLSKIPAVANYLLRAAKLGTLRNRDGDFLEIDLNNLPIGILDAIAKNCNFFKKLPPTMSWSEARRLFEPAIPNRNGARVYAPAVGWALPQRNPSGAKNGSERIPVPAT